MWALCGLGVVATIRHLCLLRHQGPSHRGIVFFRLHSHLNGSQLPLLHSFPYTPPASSTTKTWTKQTWHGSTQRWNQTAPWPTTKNLWKCRGLKLHACHSNPDSWNISGNSTHKPPEHFLQNHWTKIWEILRSKVDSNSGTNLKTNRWSRKKKSAGSQHLSFWPLKEVNMTIACDKFCQIHIGKYLCFYQVDCCVMVLGGKKSKQ